MVSVDDHSTEPVAKDTALSRFRLDDSHPWTREDGRVIRSGIRAILPVFASDRAEAEFRRFRHSIGRRNTVAAVHMVLVAVVYLAMSFFVIERDIRLFGTFIGAGIFLFCAVGLRVLFDSNCAKSSTAVLGLEVFTAVIWLLVLMAFVLVDALGARFCLVYPRFQNTDRACRRGAFPTIVFPIFVASKNVLRPHWYLLICFFCIGGMLVGLTYTDTPKDVYFSVAVEVVVMMAFAAHSFARDQIDHTTFADIIMVTAARDESAMQRSDLRLLVNAAVPSGLIDAVLALRNAKEPQRHEEEDTRTGTRHVVVGTVTKAHSVSTWMVPSEANSGNNNNTNSGSHNSTGGDAQGAAPLALSRLRVRSRNAAACVLQPMGLGQTATTRLLKDTVQAFHKFATILDEAVRHFGIDEAIMYGDEYIATAGIFRGNLSRLCAFAAWLTATAHKFKKHLPVHAAIGLGALEGGLTGEFALRYLVHGPALQEAYAIIEQVPLGMAWMYLEHAGELAHGLENVVLAPVAQTNDAGGSTAAIFGSLHYHQPRRGACLDEDEVQRIDEDDSGSKSVSKSRASTQSLVSDALTADQRASQAESDAAMADEVAVNPFSSPPPPNARAFRDALGRKADASREEANAALDALTADQQRRLEKNNNKHGGGIVGGPLDTSSSSTDSYDIGLRRFVDTEPPTVFFCGIFSDADVEAKYTLHAKILIAERSVFTYCFFALFWGCLIIIAGIERWTDSDTSFANGALDNGLAFGGIGGTIGIALSVAALMYVRLGEVGHEDNITFDFADLQQKPRLADLDEEGSDVHDANLYMTKRREELGQYARPLAAGLFVITFVNYACLIFLQRSVITNAVGFIATVTSTTLLNHALLDLRWVFGFLLCVVLINAPIFAIAVYHIGVNVAPFLFFIFSSIAAGWASFGGPQLAREMFALRQVAERGINTVRENEKLLRTLLHAAVPAHVFDQAVKALRNNVARRRAGAADAAASGARPSELKQVLRREPSAFVSELLSEVIVSEIRVFRSTLDTSDNFSMGRRVKFVDGSGPTVVDRVAEIGALVESISKGELRLTATLGDSFIVAGPLQVFTASVPRLCQRLLNILEAVARLLRRRKEVFIASIAIEEAMAAMIGEMALRYNIFGVAAVHSSALLDLALMNRLPESSNFPGAADNYNFAGRMGTLCAAYATRRFVDCAGLVIPPPQQAQPPYADDRIAPRGSIHTLVAQVEQPPSPMSFNGSSDRLDRPSGGAALDRLSTHDEVPMEAPRAARASDMDLVSASALGMYSLAQAAGRAKLDVPLPPRALPALRCRHQALGLTYAIPIVFAPVDGLQY
jgi:hypothetical protein